MTDLAIKVEHLAKQYRLGMQQAAYKTFRESLVNAAGAPIRWLKGERRPVPTTFWALDDVSFEIKQGEAVGIIGRNGAGKSTLLKILSHITSPTKGRVDLYGRVGSLLEVGTGFHPELTGRENIYLNGAILGMSRVEITRKFDEIVDFSGVEKFLDTAVKYYSSGMYVRLAFAVAAHLEPEILLVDEVLAVGDAEFQKKCLGKMDDVAHEGRTVLFVSHNMAAIEKLCKSIILLQKGVIEKSGEANAVIEYYLSSFNSNKLTGSLENRTDREGNGKVRVIDIKLLNEKREQIYSIEMGQTFIVQITTKGKLAKSIIGILFGNSMRKQIIRGYSLEQVTQLINLNGNDVIECTFREFPLIHGTYQIHIWLGEYPSECVDYVENAYNLIVDPVDIFKTGHIPDPSGGVAFVNVDWKVNGNQLS